MPSPLNDEELHILDIINITANTVSIAGSLFIIFLYMYFTKIRNFAFKLVALLSLSDILFGVANLMRPSDEDGFVCVAQGFLKSFFGNLSIIMTSVIAWVCYASVVKKKKNVDSFHTQITILAMVLIYCLLLSLIPVFFDAYGYMDMGNGDDVWCWIKQNEEHRALGLALILGTFYLPLLVCISYNSYVYYRVSATFKRILESLKKNGPFNPNNLKQVDRLRYYPIILVVCFAPACANRLYISITENQVFWVWTLHLGLASLQGMFNAMVYGYNPTVRKELRERCGCIKKEEEIPVSRKPMGSIN